MDRDRIRRIAAKTALSVTAVVVVGSIALYWVWHDRPDPGDIIILHSPADNEDIVKRVIGVGGDNVQVANGLVYVNGVELDETAYTYAAPGDNEPTVAKNAGNAWDVPEGQLFVLGDHRQASTDSRRESVGLVDVEDVVGRAWLRFFPLDTLGIVQVPSYPELDEA